MSLTQACSLLERPAPWRRGSAPAPDEIDATRELPRPLFEALADAGLFHMALPRALGGAESTCPPTSRSSRNLARPMPARLGDQPGRYFCDFAARMPHDVVRRIWIDTPRSVVSNTPAPTARAVMVPGGYRVTATRGSAPAAGTPLGGATRVYRRGRPAAAA